MNICINVGGKYSWVRVDIPIPLDTLWNKMYDKWFAEKKTLQDLREQQELFAEIVRLEREQFAMLNSQANEREVKTQAEKIRHDFSKLAEANIRSDVKVERPFQNVNESVKVNGRINLNGSNSVNGRKPSRGNVAPRKDRKRGK